MTQFNSNRTATKYLQSTMFQSALITEKIVSNLVCVQYSRYSSVHKNFFGIVDRDLRDIVINLSKFKKKIRPILIKILLKMRCTFGHTEKRTVLFRTTR